MVNQPEAPSQSPESGNAIDMTVPEMLSMSSPSGIRTAAPATRPITKDQDSTQASSGVRIRDVNT